MGRNIHIWRNFLLAALFAGLLFSAGYSNAEDLVASGCSVSNVGYLMDLAEQYEKRAGVRVLVRGGGSVVGIEDLRKGRVDFAASCRSRLEGDPEDIEFIQVAWDALVAIVHPSNPVADISKREIRGIYSGAIADWKSLGGSDARIKVLISRPGKGLSGVEWSVRKLMLEGKEPAQTEDTIFLASTGIVEQMLERTPEGFASTGFSSARKRNVKMLKVGGVYPTKKSISDDTYPFRRPLYLVIPRNPKPAVRKFLDFVLSEEGQRYIGSLGVVARTDVK